MIDIEALEARINEIIPEGGQIRHRTQNNPGSRCEIFRFEKKGEIVITVNRYSGKNVKARYTVSGLERKRLEVAYDSENGQALDRFMDQYR